jgi:glycerol uptake facilitator-like aquaporin
VLSKTDRVLKGICISFIFIACIAMTRGSGGCLNPALGFAQSLYMLLLLPSGYPIGEYAKFMWVYIGMPFVGAALSALFYYFHASEEDKDRKAKGLESSEYTKAQNALKEA